jgi:TetR/AcrR family transcriptional regulator, transcriptional repressor for nem operon
MARPRTFDPDTVLDAALQVFWSKGFHGTSFDDITAVSGLTKPSLYAAFGDKNALFRKALDRYHGFLLKRTKAQLAKGVTAREAIAAWLADYIPLCTGSRGARGCFSINTLTDSALDDAEITGSAVRFYRDLEAMVAARLTQGASEFPDDFNAAATARTMIAAYAGLMVLAKDAPSAAETKAVAAQLLRLLDTPS